MLHAAATLIGFGLLWLVFTQSGVGFDSWVALAVAAFVSVAISARLFGVSGVYARTPQYVSLVIARAGGVVRGALGAVRAGIAADVRLKPALVLVRSRTGSDVSKAAFADLISAGAGAVVVDADADGLLVHVLDEDHVDAERLGRLEARVIGALEGARGA